MQMLARRAALCALLCLTAAQAQAAPERYRLDTARSQVGFTYQFEGGTRQGTMPVKSARILLDLANLPASRIAVTLDARQARAGFVFATQAMKGATVLDTARFPEIRFRATRITGTLSAATVAGELTIRGVTRPVTLDAGLYRQQGTAPRDRSRLTVLLTGTISRSAFGADGHAGLVGDAIGLRIVARIEK